MIEERRVLHNQNSAKNPNRRTNPIQAMSGIDHVHDPINESRKKSPLSHIKFSDMGGPQYQLQVRIDRHLTVQSVRSVNSSTKYFWSNYIIVYCIALYQTVLYFICLGTRWQYNSLLFSYSRNYGGIQEGFISYILFCEITFLPIQAADITKNMCS